MNITVTLNNLHNTKLYISQEDDRVIKLFNINLSNNKCILQNTKLCSIIFIKLLDNTKDFNFDLLILYLDNGIKFFTNLELSSKIIKKITKWIKQYGKNRYIWNSLTSKPDYNLELYKNRYWPFINVKDNNWKSIAHDVKSEYPSQLDNLHNDNIISNIKKGTIINSSNILDEIELSRDFNTEYNISQKYNNFLGYTILDPMHYSDINTILFNIEVLYKFKLYELVFECLIRLLITPDLCHIIKHNTFKNLVNNICKNNLYTEIYTHYYYYAIYILNHENTIMFSRIKRTHRIIFEHTELLNIL